MIKIMWVIYFICLIPAFVTLSQRMSADAGFNKVCLVADYVQLLELAQTENVPVDEILDRVRDEAGIDHIALLEDTPEFLAQRGLCTIVEGVGWPGWMTEEERDEIRRNRGREVEEATPPENDWPLLMGLSHDMTHLIFSDHDIFARIAETAQARYPGLVQVEDRGVDGGVVSLAGEPKIILEWGLGFDPLLIEEFRGMGFILYPRLKDYPGFTLNTASEILSKTMGIFPDSVLIFDGDSITGGEAVTRELSGGSWVWRWKFGWIEFAEQKWSAELAHYAPSFTVRVHSIEDEEMEVITVDRAIARYERAVRERSVRLVYLKPFLLQTDTSNRIDKTIRMFSGVKNALESRGYISGEPGFITSEPDTSLFIQFFSVLALAIACVLLLHTLNVNVKLSHAITILVILIVFWLVGGLFGIVMEGEWLGRKLIALGLALVSPTLAVAWITKKYDDLERKLPGTFSLGTALKIWFGGVGISLTAGLLIHSILINTHLLLQIDSFSGVKIALYLPILLAILIGVRLILPPQSRSIMSAVSYLLNMPLKIWHVILGLLGLVVLFIMLDRSGNFPVINVADWENNIRGWFETMLYARPRTKEMLVGHPAMITGLILGLSMLPYRRPLMYAGIVLGSIGLTSMVNTFCHIHTPLVLSLFRTFAGIVIGGVIGIVAGFILLWVLKRIGRMKSG
ncbi:MAG: DUF5693 family protein [bacterium]|nr:DUF5693 family protein [bacterium]